MLPLLVVPANLLVFPLIAPLIPLGFLAAATGFVLPASLLVAALTSVVSVIAAVPGSCPTLPPPPTVALVVWYAGLLGLSRLPRIGRLPLALAVAALGALAASGPLLRERPAEPSLTILSVGHGAAVVLTTPEGGVLLYDVGSRRPRVAERVVIPYLLARGISALDALVLSHGDADHVSGAAPLLARMPAGRLSAPGGLRAGDGFSVPGARVEVLWPPAGAPLVGNDTSTVLRIRAAALTALLTGDLEEEGIRGLLRSGADVAADVLVVPHHGRECPASADLLAAVRPLVLVSSDGPEDRLDPVWREAFRTSRDGAITVRPGARVATFR
jgi:competence protein ComEC